MQRLVVAVVILFGTAAALVQAHQESPPLSAKQDPEETPAQAKKEAEKPDTKATARDLAESVQNPVAKLIHPRSIRS